MHGATAAGRKRASRFPRNARGAGVTPRCSRRSQGGPRANRIAGVTVVPGEIGDPELAAAVWDLDPLVDGGGADGASALLDHAARRAAGFAGRYGGPNWRDRIIPSLAGSMLEVAGLPSFVAGS